MVQWTIVLGLPGLQCVSCVPIIESAVRLQDGVIWAVLNYAAEEITIIYDPTMVSPAQLKEAVQKLGPDPGLRGARLTGGPKQLGREVGASDATSAPTSGTSLTVAAYERGRRSRLTFLHR